MNEAGNAPRTEPDAREILEKLTAQQFVRPHQSVRAAMTAAGAGCACGTRAMAWLGIDPEGVVGRLRRTELTQLARATARMLRVAQATERGLRR